MNFDEVKNKILTALRVGFYQHEVRRNISAKNKLQTGEVSAGFVSLLIAGSTTHDYRCSPHHQDASVDVHVISRNAWYIKFYFLDQDTIFISVHQ